MADMVTYEELDKAAELTNTPQEEEVVPDTPPEDPPANNDPVGDSPKEEPPPEDPPKEEPPKEEDDDHKEKSGLGRKVKRLESQIETLLERIHTMQSTPAVKKEDPPADEDEYIKASDVPKIMARFSEEEQAKTSKYENDYLYNTVKLGAAEGLTTELQDEVFDEMQANHNKRRTGNPDVDAELNYRAALVAVYAKKASTPRNPLKGGGDDKALGVGAPTSAAPKDAPKKVKLDSVAAEFAKSVGMTDEQIASALEKKRPALRMNSKMM